MLYFSPRDILNCRNGPAISSHAPYDCFPVRLEDFLPVKAFVSRHPVNCADF
jgi:ribosomal protein RSM22 (predicted rRNA methylase)